QRAGRTAGPAERSTRRSSTRVQSPTHSARREARPGSARTFAAHTNGPRIPTGPNRGRTTVRSSPDPSIESRCPSQEEDLERALEAREDSPRENRLDPARDQRDGRLGLESPSRPPLPNARDARQRQPPAGCPRNLVRVRRGPV